MLYERRYNFQTGETIIADQIDDEFNAIRTILNGNVEGNNIKDASITTSKLEASLNPTTRTQETVGDIVVSGLEMQIAKGLTTVAWTNRDETFSNGVIYLRGNRVDVTGGAKTFQASATTWVLADDSGNLHYEVGSTLPAIGYTALLLYKVVCDSTKITSCEGLAWGQVAEVTPYAHTTAPNGALVCQGQEVSRSTYSKLFNLIQTKFGTPSSNAVFKLPDLRTRTVHGHGNPSSYVNWAETGGAVDKNHSHGAWSNNAGYHGHGTGASYYDGGWGIVANTSGAWGDHAHPINAGGEHSHGVGTSNTNVNVDPYIVMHYIIKAQ